MKKITLLIVCIIFLIFTNCKKEDTEVNDVKAKEEVIDDSYNIILDVVIKKDDDVALYYTTDGSVEFKIEPIWQGVKGSELVQQIVFKLPKDIKPTQFRFDFGMNPKQEDIYLNKVTFKYIGKERVIAIPELVDYFRANDNYCTFDAVTGLIQAKKGPNTNGSSSSIYPHEKNLGPELSKLF